MGQFMSNMINLTRLRQNIYELIDKVIKTGKSIEINRNGHIIKISLKKTRLSVSKEYLDYLQEIKQKISAIKNKKTSKNLILLYHYIGTSFLEKQKEYNWKPLMLERLSKDLQKALPGTRGLSTRTLQDAVLFAKTHTDIAYLGQYPTKLPWWHNVYLLKFADDTKRLYFYTEEAVRHKWTREELISHIEDKYYEKYFK
jgi:predicted nuclease of restriction endonuclease-like (RecB) superfamily